LLYEIANQLNNKGWGMCEEKFKTLRKCALVVVLLATSPALAFDTNKLGQGGSLPLSDLDPLIGQSAKLKAEVAAALVRINKKADDVICAGNRFPREWVNLGGLRTAPYACDFKGKWLVLKAQVRVTGADATVYDAITPAAMQNAAKVTETQPTWKWTTKDPSP
jgi:hypothetical protein